MTSGRLSAAVVVSVACALAGCGGDEARAGVEDGEWLPGGSTTNTVLVAPASAFAAPVPDLDFEQRQAFFSGNSFFTNAWVTAPSSTSARDGLGPLFNASSCAGCHFRDGRGRPPLEADERFVGLLLRLSVDGVGPDGAPLPDPVYGGQLQPFAIDGVPAEGNPRVTYTVVPGQYADGEPYELLAPSYRIDELALGPLAEGLLVSPRVAPAMIGLGLLEAIDEARLRELADPDDADGDGISGRLNEVWDVERGALSLGRFGWKAEQPSVRQQVAAAFLGDLGVTSSLFPEQDCMPAQEACSEAPAGGEPEVEDLILERVQRYSELLAVPARTAHADAEVLSGKALFEDLGCGGCHVPSHVTGSEHAVSKLHAQRIWPYTDLLLHDMGEGLADGRPSFGASGREWRTPPLWGLRFYRVVNDHDRLLHDGRARGVAEAILWHGGEAEPSKVGFVALSKSERAALIRFVESL